MLLRFKGPNENSITVCEPTEKNRKQTHYAPDDACVQVHTLIMNSGPLFKSEGLLLVQVVFSRTLAAVILFERSSNVGVCWLS